MVQAKAKQGPKMDGGGFGSGGSVGGGGGGGAAAGAGRASKAGSTAAKPKKSFGAKVKGKAVAGTVVVGGGFVAAKGLQNVFGGDNQVDPTDPNAVAAAAVATYAASGGDVNAVANNPALTTLGIDPNTFISNYGAITDIPLTTGGVYLGDVETTIRVPKRGVRTTMKPQVMSTYEWDKRFPIGNPQELANFKKKLIDAGIVTAAAGLPELQTEWKRFGEFSAQAYKAGQKLTPDQIIDIQKGLYGGGSNNGPSYSIQYSSPEAIKNIYAQTYTARTGKILTDKQQEDFVNYINKLEESKPTKTETKVVRGKKVTVTTPGFTAAEIAAEAENRAMQDPQYKEYQTATVFGDGLSKALGIR